MKGAAVFLLILLVPGVNAVWEQFQFDDVNSGRVSGIGYFDSRTLTNITNYLDGYDMQPLIGDINNDGKNEIIIFSGNYLKVFGNKLNLIDEKYVGKLQGQPTIFNIDEDNFKEIIFISNITSTPYFFAYEFNSTDFNQEFNFTVPNGAIGSGIKCTGIGSTNVCVFMDNAQYVHIVNLSSQTNRSYNTSVYTDTSEKIPAIGDLHNDGGKEAVFWFNTKGLMVFNLINKQLDSAFNNSGIVDDVVKPYGARFVLKGHPVLVDLNNDGKLEIAVSAFYDDENSREMYTDWFTELFVYNSSGDKLFSKCGQTSDGGCNDGSSTASMWEGTNPFTLDVNNDNIDDICFIKDKKVGRYFKNMTINCYNYFGDILLDSELIGGAKTATVADMNNDGAMEIVTESRIYALDGTPIFAHNFGSNFAIPVDIDGNNGLDLISSKDGQTNFYLDNLGSVEISNVSITPQIPSIDNKLTCSWVVNGDETLTANVNWYKNNILQSTETNIRCTNNTICTVNSEISSSLTLKNDLWKCSVSASNENYDSYSRFDEVKILGKTSEWVGAGNTNDNSCRQSGKGYFGIFSIENKSSADGMNFEPIATDINNNGKNEIIIFSDSKLKIFNHSLDLIDETNVGNLVAQPTIYNMDSDINLEIIFMANINSTSYFMAYEYNNKFTQQCNLTISNGASGSGIRCVDIGNTKSCFFKDQKNVFYSINMTNCTQNANLTTNNQEDATPTIPSILDYDKDSKLEGIWWFNNDNDQFIGIAVIELESMTFDTGFNGDGFIDDITQGDGKAWNRPGFENLKGNPIFYQQDNAGSYEILVAYDNEKIAGGVYDEFKCFRSVLKLFDTDGTLLWTLRPETCNPHTGIWNCDMSTPVIVDADNNGYDDICFLMKGDPPCYREPYLNTIHDYLFCIDRFGNNAEGFPKNSSDITQYSGASVGADTNMYIADMDNDGEVEMVGVGYIWNFDGTILQKNYSSFSTYAPIPIDLDKNKALDLLWTKNGLTTVFLDNNNYFYDFAISEEDILFQKNNIKITVHNNGNLYAENVVVLAINTDTMQNKTGFVSVKGNGKATLNFNIDLSEGQELLVQLDYNNEFNESNEKNNFAFKTFEDFPYVFVSVDLEINRLEEEFEDFIKDNLKSSYYTDNENDASVKVYIGKNNLFNKQKILFTKNNYDYYYDFGNINHKDEIGSYPYNGLIGAYKENDIIYILIYGNEIDGNIAAVKEFINNEVDFLNINDEKSYFVGNENSVAVKVFDFLHNTGNENNYKVDNDAFKQIVRNALGDEMYTEQDYTVNSASGVNLRLRNLKPNASSMYLSYLNDTGIPVELPVVLARGLWSNLSGWQVLASELANEGRDSWLIEITGGPGQDCDSCPDYTFDNLTDDYVPTLLNGVLTFTGKNQLQYVGFSNGCRATLSSLERGKFDPNKVETFVGVGCPGAFEGNSIFGIALNDLGDNAINEFRSQEIKHISFRNIFEAILPTISITNGVNTISVNLFEKYYNISISENDKQPGENLSLNKFAIIQGDFFGDNDGIVTTQDESQIFNKINASPKWHFRILATHKTLADRTKTKTLIKKTLNNESLSFFETTFLLINQS